VIHPFPHFSKRTIQLSFSPYQIKNTKVPPLHETFTKYQATARRFAIISHQNRALVVVTFLHSKALCELPSPSHGLRFVRLPEFSNCGIKRIVRVWSRHKRLNGEKYCSNLKSGAPLVFQYIKADSSKLINVGVVYLCQEADLGGRHGIV